MSQPGRRRPPATYEDLLNVSDRFVAELVDGELFATPRPSPRHADAGSGLAGALRAPFDRGRGGPGGWRILFEPELHLGRDVLVPDLAGWRRERLPLLPDEAYFTLAPDWVSEVVSPSTAALDRVKKLAVYARERVTRVARRSDRPDARNPATRGRTLTIESTASGSEAVRVQPFDAIELDLTLLWEEPPADRSER